MLIEAGRLVAQPCGRRTSASRSMAGDALDAAQSRRRSLVLLGAACLVGASAFEQATAAGVRRVGYLMPRSAREPVDDAFLEGMRSVGYVVDRDVVIEYRWAGVDPGRLRQMAQQLVDSKVDVIVTATTAGVRTAMQATRSIPIVMAAAADPVASKLVDSLARPGGNVTGVSLQTTDIARKRLQQLVEIVPGARRIGLLAQRVASPDLGTTDAFVAETQTAAMQLGVGLVVHQFAAAAELTDAFAFFRRERADAVIVQAGPLTIQHRERIAELAASGRLPAMYEIVNFVEAGGLAAYGPDLRDNYRRAATYVHRLLNGARPADLPVEQPSRIVLLVNRRAAQALGLAIPAHAEQI